MAGFDPQLVLDALAQRPDGRAALALEGFRVAAVGGFVRDTLLGREPRELDLVVEGDVDEVASALGGVQEPHPQFLAVHVSGERWQIEVTQARSERYERPGALPLVAPASIDEDLARRDFTVNAIAVELHSGRLLSADGALEDLAAGRLRVLHDASFEDDPTRVMRLARYALRTGFTVDPHTAALARRATLTSVSGARIGSELALILAEEDPPAVLAELADKLPLSVDRGLVERTLALLPPDGDRGVATLAASTFETAPGSEWIEALELGAAVRDALLEAPRAPAIAGRLAETSRPSERRQLLRRVPVEVIALAGALGPRDAVKQWLDTERHVALEISGEDLLAAGLPEGPELGARLERTLVRKLDGELEGGRAAELASALGGEA
jgi:tRNA nucleotidyltransferase (CCA-adding enzyme)